MEDWLEESDGAEEEEDMMVQEGFWAANETKRGNLITFLTSCAAPNRRRGSASAAAAMPRLASSSRYCRVSGTGYRGVRARPKGTYYAEIRDGGERIGLGTYETAHEAARAYDAVAWRLGRPRSSMNFHDVWTRQQAEDLAPPPYIVRQEEQHRRRETERRLRIAERDERAAREWAARFPEDVAAENEHFRRRRAEKATRRAAKKEDRWRVFHTFVGQPQEEGMMRTAASFPSERNQGLSNQEEPRSTLKVDGGGM
ncbi:hypothetical protein QYE76_034243 [Lolium multiflorum]|uniref:AP2/ERF domain-containing protein n=1 Tax=Lolium multiflorum TaxID=4521 RepID=A0AAD8QY85_LOLMU|nr:hypothetical protein QYE76_034243 [Lolium multiflorum]